MSNLDASRREAATASKPVALACALAIALLAFIGAWILWSAPGRVDSALSDWIDPLYSQASIVERDIADADRLLRLFVLQGRAADSKSFEDKRAEVAKSIGDLRAIAQRADRVPKEAAETFAVAAEKWAGFADEWFKAARSETADANRTAVMARMGPEDPLADMIKERKSLEAAVKEARQAHLATAASAEGTRPVRMFLGFGLVAAGCIVGLFLALRSGSRGTSTAPGIDTGLIRAVLDQIPDAVAIFGEDGKLVVSNLAASRVVESVDLGEQGQRSRLALFGADDEQIEDGDSPLTLALAGHHVHERNMFATSYDGSRAPVEVHADPVLDNGRATAAVVVVRDKSSEMRFESDVQAANARAESLEANVAELTRQLRKSDQSLASATATVQELSTAAESNRLEAESKAERFRRLIEGSGTVGVALFDVGEFVLLDANVPALELLGERRRARDVRGSKLIELAPGCESSGLADLFRKVAASGEPYSSEEYYAQGLRHGAAYWSFSLIPMAATAGGPAEEIVLIGNNITEAVESRAEVAATAAARGDWKIEDVLLALANDLRTPILSIQGMIELFRAKYAEAVPDVTALHYLELTQRNADQIAGLIDGLVDLSALGTAEMSIQEIPLAQTIEEAWRANQRPGIELRVAGPLPTVRADRPMIQRAFRDLFDEAARLKKDGVGAWMHVRVRDAGQHWEVELTDNGKGIGDSDPEAHFGPLARNVVHVANGAGPTLVANGVGLAAVRRVAELHGGAASARNGDEEGALFAFTIAK